MVIFNDSFTPQIRQNTEIGLSVALIAILGILSQIVLVATVTQENNDTRRRKKFR